MRVLISAVVLSVLASGGVASAQIQVPAQTPVTTVARAAYTVEPFTPAAQVTIQGTGVRLRAEPFTTQQTQVLSSGSTGLALNVVGIARMSDWNWYQVVLKNGQKAFIRSDLTSAPSRGGNAATIVATTPTAPAYPEFTPTAPLPPTVTVQPAPNLGPAIPITPQPIPIAPPVGTTPVPSTGGGLDLPRPSDPPGLQSR